MIKEDIIKLYNVIQLEKSKGSVKFRYLLLKNEGTIKEEISTLNAIEKDIEKILDPFTKERNELIKKIGVFNEKIKAYEVPKNLVDRFYKKLEPIKNKYKKILDEHDKKYKEYLDVLKEEVPEPFKFIEINLEDIPQDLKTESLEILMKLGILK